MWLNRHAIILRRLERYSMPEEKMSPGFPEASQTATDVGEPTSQTSSVIHSHSTDPKKPNKKLWVITGISLVILLMMVGIGAAGYSVLKGPTPTPTPVPTKKRVVEPANVIPVAERPVVYLVPEADGRNLTLEIISIQKPASSVEYELEYQSGELLQGVNGTIELTAFPARTTQLMGTCSAGGKCSYHENVQGGKLQLRFIGEENYLLSQEWRYIDNKAKADAISSRDGKFQFTSQAFPSVRYMIVYNSPGLPEGLPGTPISDIYSLQSSAPIKGEGELSIRSSAEGASAIAVWDGTSWQVIPGTSDGKTVTATVPVALLYVAISQ